ncbi:MAG: hypothetical protein ACK5XX_07870 [Holosporales bacterium]|jgi:hypothetical protein
MKQILKMLGCLVIAVCFTGVLADSANAQNPGARTGKIGGGATNTGANNFFSQTDTLVQQTYKQGSGVVYGVGGLGAIGLGALAMFGRFQWQWLMALVGGLLTIAGVGSGIQYLTGANVTQ